MAGRFAKGWTIWMGDAGSPENFVKIAHIKSIDGPQANVRIVETTTHDTEGNFVEKLAVLIDAGKLSFMINWNPDLPTHDPELTGSLWNVLEGLEERYFQLRAAPSNPNAQVGSFQGFVTQHSLKLPVDNVQDASITIDIDGAVTWTSTP